jgi:NDP-sugar pyrophosphorylase family protein
MREIVRELISADTGREAKMYHLLAALIAQGKDVRVTYTTGHWLDVDRLDDVVAAGRFA